MDQILNLFMQPAVQTRVKMLIGFSVVLGAILVALLLPFLPTLTFSSAKQEREEATKKALAIYRQQKAANVSFEDGPCIAEQLIPDWVADIVHNPRQPVDEQPENQCQSYREGKAHHFVELSPEGTIIRVQ